LIGAKFIFCKCITLPFIVIAALMIVCKTSHALSIPVQTEPVTVKTGIKQAWWKHAVIYEIYPRSFQDSNGDGVGDIKGIIKRLDYLHELGIDAIWLTPIYPSPQVDFGYDISNYEAIDPQYGTMADFDKLVAEAKKRNIRILMDMVLNHTSDKHPWFLESSSSRVNPKRDWYIWRDGKGENIPPNNWMSGFGHSAWQYDEKTGQWFYHMFYKQQPDLNWRNPAVEKAMFEAVRFWFNRGVAGFRLDAVTMLFEDPELRDERVLGGTNAYGDPVMEGARQDNLPEVHDVIRRLRKVVDRYPGNRVLIGETYLHNIGELDQWYGGVKHDEIHLPMDMQIALIPKLDAILFRQRIEEVETKISGNQPLIVFDNHDRPRSWNRYGDGVHDLQIARIVAAMLFTTRATAMMYYGEELGMVTSTPTRKEDVKDPIGIMGWPNEKGRDGERTPMQWDGAQNAGFSVAQTTWLSAGTNYKTVNAKAEAADPSSLLNWHKRLIMLRKTNPALRNGLMLMLDETNPSVLSYLRKGPSGKPSVVVSMNFTGTSQTVSLDTTTVGVRTRSANTILTSDSSLQSTKSLFNITLPPFAVWIGSVR